MISQYGQEYPYKIYVEMSLWRYSVMGVWIQYLYKDACIYKGCNIMIIDSSAFHNTNEDKQDDEVYIEHWGKK